MAGDLFSAAAEEVLSTTGPLADRLRPASLDQVVGQDHLLAKGRPLRALIDSDRLTSVILWGPPGTGKTTIARLLAGASSKAFVHLSAVTATVKDIRETAALAQQRLGADGRGTILFLDEIHRFTRSQQDALLPSVETGLLTLIGATTENPYFEVNPPLLSRSTLLRLEPLSEEGQRELTERGLRSERATATDEAVEHLIAVSGGDGRSLLTTLDVAIALARSRAGDSASPSDQRTPELRESWNSGAHRWPATRPEEDSDRTVRVEQSDVEDAMGSAAVVYGRDDHYDVVSAFIKSIRGSDPDAALHWLARMLEAGEDARFIARRLVVAASEDIGLADSNALLVATAAASAVEFVGLPEARINLAHATVYLSLAPKSNSAYMALDRAIAQVRSGDIGVVPPHLRDSHYRGAQTLGHGIGYRYPHDEPGSWVDQQYLPERLAGTVYFHPGDQGAELRSVDRWKSRRQT